MREPRSREDAAALIHNRMKIAKDDGLRTVLESSAVLGWGVMRKNAAVVPARVQQAQSA